MIVGLFPELLAPGGVQRAGRHTAAVLASHAARRRTPVWLVSLNDPHGLHRREVGRLEFEFQGFGRNKWRFVATALRLALARPSLVVAAHPHLAPLAWVMKALAPGVRAVIMTHGIEVWAPLPFHRRWALRRADFVLAPSSETARHLVMVQGLAESRVRCVPWGLDPELARAAGLAASVWTSFERDSRGRNGPRPAPHGRAVLTVARLAPGDRDKGVDSMIEAVSRLVPSFPDVSLVVIGDGADRPRLEGIARECGVPSRVQFSGHVPPDTLAEAYRRCDVFALPSRKEGFGLAHLEAMAFGKPVVGGAHGGTPDIVEDGVTGYLVPHSDVGRLTEVLRCLLEDNGLRAKMGRLAQERVGTRYLFEHFSSRLAGVLDEAEKGGTGGDA